MINRSTLAGFLAVLLWSSTVALSRSISEKIGPLLVGFTVYTTAGLILTIYWAARGKKIGVPRENLASLAGRGLLFLIYTFSLYLALGLAADRLQSVEIGLLNYLWPSLTLILSLPLLGKKASFWLIPGTLLALVGITLVLTQGSQVTWSSFSGHILNSPVSYGLGLLAAFAWAFYSNLTRRWSKDSTGREMPLFMLATGLAFGLAALFNGEPLAAGGGTLIEIFLLAAFSAAGYMLWDLAMLRGDLILVAAASYLTPFFSTVVSSLYLQVTPSISLWLGCLLIIAGSLLSWRSFARDSI